jgi:hypothetical protein
LDILSKNMDESPEGDEKYIFDPILEKKENNKKVELVFPANPSENRAGLGLSHQLLRTKIRMLLHQIIVINLLRTKIRMLLHQVVVKEI